MNELWGACPAVTSLDFGHPASAPTTGKLGEEEWHARSCRRRELAAVHGSSAPLGIPASQYAVEACARQVQSLRVPRIRPANQRSKSLRWPSLRTFLVLKNSGHNCGGKKPLLASHACMSIISNLAIFPCHSGLLRYSDNETVQSKRQVCEKLLSKMYLLLS